LKNPNGNLHIRNVVCLHRPAWAFIGGTMLYGSLGTKALSEDKEETGTKGNELVTTDEGMFENFDEMVGPDFRGGLKG